MSMAGPAIAPLVLEAYDSYPAELREPLLKLRGLIYEVARGIDAVGPITETLKWGQPAYVTEATKAGTTIRLAPHGRDGKHYALFVHCGTSLIERFRSTFGTEVRFDGNRAIVWEAADAPDLHVARCCIEAALTYHLGGPPSAPPRRTGRRSLSARRRS